VVLVVEGGKARFGGSTRLRSLEVGDLALLVVLAVGLVAIYLGRVLGYGLLSWLS
jgi:hypothetical protein